MRCWRSELLPAQTCTASPPCGSSTALAPSAPKFQSWLERNPKEELRSSQPLRLSHWDRIRAGHSAVVTSQVGGECSSQEGRAEVLALTPHTTSRALLGQLPHPAPHIPRESLQGMLPFRGKLAFEKLKSKWERAKRTHVYDQKVGELTGLKTSPAELG